MDGGRDCGRKIVELLFTYNLCIILNNIFILSHHFMTNQWGNNGNHDILFFLDSKITADGDCSHEIKRRLLLGRKAITNLDSI